LYESGEPDPFPATAATLPGRELADLGYRNIHGEPFAAESIAGMIRQARRI
jgi:hypothetical protein